MVKKQKPYGKGYRWAFMLVDNFLRLLKSLISPQKQCRSCFGRPGRTTATTSGE